jgi:hypothetical protein
MALLVSIWSLLDVRDVGQRLECSTGLFLVPQIDRQKVDVAAAGQLGLAA